MKKEPTTPGVRKASGLKACPGLRSPSDESRPAAVCRDCKRRIAHIRGEGEGVEMLPYRMWARQFDKRRLRCDQKVRAG